MLVDNDDLLLVRRDVHKGNSGGLLDNWDREGIIDEDAYNNTVLQGHEQGFALWRA